MKSILIITILISLTKSYGILGLNYNYHIGKDKDINVYGTIYHPARTIHYFGAGLTYNFERVTTITGEWHTKYERECFGCKYYTIKVGLSTDKGLLFELDHTYNILLFNLKLNLIQIRVKDESKPDYRVGVGIGIGVQT